VDLSRQLAADRTPACDSRTYRVNAYFLAISRDRSRQKEITPIPLQTEPGSLKQAAEKSGFGVGRGCLAAASIIPGINIIKSTRALAPEVCFSPDSAFFSSVLGPSLCSRKLKILLKTCNFMQFYEPGRNLERIERTI
jgi:hypothetical protein